MDLGLTKLAASTNADQFKLHSCNNTFFLFSLMLPFVVKPMELEFKGSIFHFKSKSNFLRLFSTSPFNA